MGVRANADTPDDASLGRSFGARRHRLCRTEHMFLGDRKQFVQDMILAEDQATKDEALGQATRRPDAGLPRHLRGDGRAAGDGTLARPPLHEFLDNPRELEVEITKLEMSGGDRSEIATKRKLLHQIDAMVEMNRCSVCGAAGSAS